MCVSCLSKQEEEEQEEEEQEHEEEEEEIILSCRSAGPVTPCTRPVESTGHRQ